MIKNYFKVTLRSMMRNKLFTFINIIGMSSSLACAILLFVYANQELNYDSHQGKSFRLISHLKANDGQVFNIGTSSVPIAPVIADQIPEIEFASRMTGGTILGSKDMITFEGDSYYIEKGYVVDSAFFDIIKLDIISGNEISPLPYSNSIVINKEWSEKLFGKNDPIGQTVSLSTLVGDADYEVSAIIDNSSYTSHLNPNYLISSGNASWQGFYDNFSSQWVSNNVVFTYLKLRPQSNIQEVTDKIHEIFISNGADEMKALGLDKTMSLQPLSSIHTNNSFMIDVPDVTNVIFIRVLIGIGILILLLACVNYINLSTAQAGNRMLEVGIRKVMGISSRGLVGQFLSESFILVLLSMIIGIGIAYISLPFFNSLIDFPISLDSIDLSFGIPALGLFLIATTLLSGLYPAIYLSSFKASTVLKGKNRDKGSAAFLRKVLVVFQFVISIILISAIVIISNQVDYIKNKDLGFNAKTKLVVPLRTNEALQQYKSLNTLFTSNSSVKAVSGTSSVPGSVSINDILVYKEGQTMDDAIHVFTNTVDINYAQTLGTNLISGSYFSGYFQDSTGYKVIINREAVDQFGYSPDVAIGKTVYFDWRGRRFGFEIVGVIENIHQNSLHQTIDPVFYQLGGEQEGYSYMLLDVQMDNIQSVTSDLSEQWKEAEIHSPFEYFTLDENLQVLYASDYKTFNLIKYFALISVLISGLGLYAISMFVAEKRFKEIGVRKALGARVIDIFLLVTRDLSVLIVIAFVISIPISIYVLNQWLDTFAYRITPGIGTYVISGLISIGIGWAAISYQSIRAALTNPVNALRDE